MDRWYIVQRNVIRLGKEHEPDQASVFTREEVNKFMISAEGDQMLVPRLTLLLGLLGRLRASDQYNLKRSHFSVLANDKGGKEKGEDLD